MGASTSALQSGSVVPVDKQFLRGKLACRFLMISNCALAVYVITRPRKRERNKVESAMAEVPSPAADDETQQPQQLQASTTEDWDGSSRE